MAKQLLSSLPSVSDLLDNPSVKGLMHRLSRSSVVSAVRVILDEVRHEAQVAASDISVPSVTELADRIARRIRESNEPQVRPVINATGALLDARVGGPPLAEAAIEEMVGVSREYTSAGLALSTGESARRWTAAASLICELSGSEAALVANSQASAVWLALAALATGREVVVARGQVGSPDGECGLVDVAANAGVRLREVGSVNKIIASDYAGAINDQTAAILIAELSDVTMLGNVTRTTIGEVARVAKERRIPLVHALGDGGLIRLIRLPQADGISAQESLEQGADLVVMAGDRLLGGPRCGIALGERNLVAKLTTHPLIGALEADQLTIAALSATLTLLRQPEIAVREIPLLRLLDTPLENLKLRAHRLADQISAAPGIAASVAVAETTYLTGHEIPGRERPTWCVAVEAKSGSIERLTQRLRCGIPAVVGRVKEKRLLFDLRSVMPRQDQLLVQAVAAACDGDAPDRDRQ